MTVRRRLAALTVATILGATPTVARADPARPFPQHVAYAPGTIGPDHRSQAALDDDVRAAYASWKRRYLVRLPARVDGVRLCRVAFGRPGTGNHRVTVSEGQGYGLVITALMAGEDTSAHRVFDGLWRFVRAHPSGIDHRLMQWRVPVGGEGRDAAFDGDADIAYALLLAHAQWGSAGRVDYRRAALRVLRGIEESMIGPHTRLPMLGDWVSPDGSPFHEATPRTSDLMPGHFRAFARFTGRRAWRRATTVASSTVEQLQGRHPRTGLLPDFTVPESGRRPPLRPAPPGFLEGPDDGRYHYNAGRDPWRLATDGLLNDSATSLTQAGRISRFLERATGGDPLAIRSGYRLDGRPSPGSNYFTTFFAAPVGVAAMTDPGQQAWLDDVYDAVRRRREDYYSDSVTLLCLLVMTHNFWDPTVPAAGRVTPRSSSGR